MYEIFVPLSSAVLVADLARRVLAHWGEADVAVAGAPETQFLLINPNRVHKYANVLVYTKQLPRKITSPKQIGRGRVNVGTFGDRSCAGLAVRFVPIRVRVCWLRIFNYYMAQHNCLALSSHAHPASPLEYPIQK